MAKKRVGKFPKAFRQMAVDRLNQCDNIGELAKELGIHRRLLYAWREKLAPRTSRLVGRSINHLGFRSMKPAGASCRKCGTP